MYLMRLARYSLAVVLLAAGLGACGAVPRHGNAIRVEVWRGGDDGLTVLLAEAIEIGFKKSSGFVLSTGNQPGTLVASIPDNVRWKEINGRTRVFYTILFKDAHSFLIGRISGECWDDQLQKCANAIVRDAENTPVKEVKAKK